MQPLPGPVLNFLDIVTSLNDTAMPIGVPFTSLASFQLPSVPHSAEEVLGLGSPSGFYRSSSFANMPGHLPCSYCDYTATNPNEYEAHMMDHSFDGLDNWGDTEMVPTTAPTVTVARTGAPSAPQQMYRGAVRSELLRCPHHPCASTFLDKAALLAHTRAHATSTHCILVPRSALLEPAAASDGAVPPFVPKERPFVCTHPGCSASFAEKGKLKRHALIHGEKPFKCSFCPLSFVEAGRLRKHQDAHSGKERDGGGEKGEGCVCPHCGQAFSESSVLKRHEMEKHAARRKYNCKECAMSLPSADALRKHASSHEKALPCPHCPSMFSFPSDLARHVRTHTGDKPHKCLLCGQSFSHSGHLNRHMASHSGAKLLPCPHCPTTFGRADVLSKHIMQVHGEAVTDAADAGRPLAVEAALSNESDSVTLPDTEEDLCVLGGAELKRPRTDDV